MNIFRSLYKDDVDFAALALQFPAFAKRLKLNGQLDFSDPEAVLQLTKTLLKRDFDLEISLPEDRLCPPVPNRLNYILWVQDLLDTTSDYYSESYDPARAVVGQDIGTGASAIYPLLGCRTRPNWKFAATDIDPENVQYARENVKRNGLQASVRIVQTTPEDALIPLGTKIGIPNVDFTMCNPPFFESQQEMFESAKKKQRPPFSACTGAPVEMITPGGEVAFVTRMIDESLQLRERVQWYTSMLGKHSSLAAIVQKLLDAGCLNFAVTEFVQGAKTRRWGVAWTWGNMRPGMEVARGLSSLPKHLLPFPSEYKFAIPNVSIDALGQKVNTSLQSLDLQWKWKPSIATGLGFAMTNTWSRQARRRRAQGSGNRGDSAEVDEEEAALGFKVSLRQGKGSEAVDVTVRWLKGRDSVQFESFCGMIKRKLEGR